MIRLNIAPFSKPATPNFKAGHDARKQASTRLDLENKYRTLFFVCSGQEVAMLKIFVEEAAALASLTLFVGMVAVWAQLFTQL